jgi:hypothetical protein
MPKFFEDKEADIEISDYRGLLPCDLIEIIQVKDLKTNLALRGMTNSFLPGGRKYE